MVKGTKEKTKTVFTSEHSPELAGKAFRAKIRQLSTLPRRRGLRIIREGVAEARSCESWIGMASALESAAHKLVDAHRLAIRAAMVVGDHFKGYLSKRNLDGFFNSLPDGWVLEFSDNPAHSWFSLDIPQPTIILSHRGLKVPFNHFVVHVMGERQEGGRLNFRLKATDVPHKGSSGRLHPHASMGNLCMGQSAQLMAHATVNWDIITAYNTFVIILKNYSARGAYSPLVTFTDQQGGWCSEGHCRRWVPREEIVACDTCGTTYCKKCAPKRTTMHCYICAETKKKARVLCSLCSYSQKTCSSCGRQICQEHSAACSECGSTLCINCLDKCPRCMENVENVENVENMKDMKDTKNERKDQ